MNEMNINHKIFWNDRFLTKSANVIIYVIIVFGTGNS